MSQIINLTNKSICFLMELDEFFPGGLMAIEISRIIKTIEQKTIETQKNLNEKKVIQPQTLDELAKAIKTLTESSGEVTHVNRSDIEKAIENLSTVELMITNIKKETDKELEETAREEMIAQISYIPVHEMITDLKTFLRLGKKVKKTSRTRTQ